MRTPYLKRKSGSAVMRPEHRVVTGQTIMIFLSERLRRSSGGGFRNPPMCRNAELQMRFEYFDVFSGLPRKDLSLRGGRRDLNPQQPEPQSGALPLSYDHHANGEKESSASSGSAKHIFRGWCGAGGSTFSTRLPSNRNSLQLASRSTIVAG